MRNTENRNNRNIRDYMQESIGFDRQRLARYKKLYDNVRTEGRLKSKVSGKSGIRRYYLVLPDSKKEIYLGRKNAKTIRALQNRRFAEEMIKIIESNIAAKQRFCRVYRDDSADAVISALPISYRPLPGITDISEAGKVLQSENPYHREQLTIKTSFGLFVRSKGELEIAELLYSLGIEFYYERALALRSSEDGPRDRIYYPDFTIPLPNGEKIYWEHKGMLSVRDYAERDAVKESVYNINGIYQPHNYIVTAEGPNNSLDMESIKRIVTGWLLPRLNA